MASEVINLAEKLARLSEHWSPRVVAEMNDYQIKLVKLQGEFGGTIKKCVNEEGGVAFRLET